MVTNEDCDQFTSLFDEFMTGFDYRLRSLSPKVFDKIQMCLIDVGSGSDTRLMVR